MRTYCTVLGNRDMSKLELTRAEATEMEAAGFRFVEFNEEAGRYRLSAPYKIAQNLERGTLTIIQ